MAENRLAKFATTREYVDISIALDRAIAAYQTSMEDTTRDDLREYWRKRRDSAIATRLSITGKYLGAVPNGH